MKSLLRSDIVSISTTKTNNPKQNYILIKISFCTSCCDSHIISIFWNFRKIRNMLENFPAYFSSTFSYFNIYTHFYVLYFLIFTWLRVYCSIKMPNLSFGAIKAGGQHSVLMGIFMEFINLDITANVLLVLHYIYSMKFH